MAVRCIHHPYWLRKRWQQRRKICKTERKDDHWRACASFVPSSSSPRSVFPLQCLCGLCSGGVCFGSLPLFFCVQFFSSLCGFWLMRPGAAFSIWLLDQRLWIWCLFCGLHLQTVVLIPSESRSGGKQACRALRAWILLRLWRCSHLRGK